MTTDTTGSDDGESTGRRESTTRRRALLEGIALGSLGTAALVGGARVVDLDAVRFGDDGGPRSADGRGQSELSAARVEDHLDHTQIGRLVALGDVTHTAAGGRWSDTEAWTGAVPDDGARVHVPVGTTLTLDGVTARLETLRVDGDLRVDPETAVHLQVGTLVVTGTGRLEVGTAATPVRDAHVTFLDGGPIDVAVDPARIGRGLLTLSGATVDVHGVETTPFLEVDADRWPRAGDRTLALSAAPTGWEPGETLVVPGLSPDDNEDEEVVVAAVDGRRVAIETPLRHDHVPPRADLPAYVVSLDRSVRFTSEDDRTERRGHVMLMSRDVRLRNAGFYDLGRTDKSRPFTDPVNGVAPNGVEPNPKARYACHVHRTGPASGAPLRIEGCVVWGSPGWGFVNHDSHVRIEDSVSYEVFGAGFVAESGTESGTFRRNFALRSHGSGEVPDARQFAPDKEGAIDDFGHGGHGFWLQGPDVTVEENVAAGHRHFGFVYWVRAKPDHEVPSETLRSIAGADPNVSVDRADRQPSLRHSEHVVDGMIPSGHLPLRSFADNTVFASGGGLDISRHQFSAHHDRVEEYSVVDRFTAFNVGRHRDERGRVRVPNDRSTQGGYNGITVRYCANIRIRDARLVAGDGEGRGVGINRNHAPSNVRVESSAVEGFFVGVRAAPRGDGHVSGTFDNHVDVQIIGGTSDRRYSPAQQVDVEAAFGDGGRANLFLGVELEGELYGLFAPEGGVSLNGTPLYFAQQAPDYVPLPTAADLHASETASLAALTDVDPESLVGASNATLFREYGLAVEGAVQPADVGSLPGVEGGVGRRGAAARPATDGPVARVHTGRGSLWEVGRLDVDEPLYVYGEDCFRTVPGRYVGLPYVRFERGDEALVRPSTVELEVTTPATLFVAYDADARPGWLRDGFAETEDVLSTTVGPRRVYERDVEAGRHWLGGCPDTQRMYSVFVRPR